MTAVTCNAYLKALANGLFDPMLRKFYGNTVLELQQQRYKELLNQGSKTFGSNEIHLVTAPGRTELAGNHTDHNHGMVLAAAIDRDCVALVSPTANNMVEISSSGFTPIQVDLNDLEVKEEEYGTPESIIRGTASGFIKRGLPVHGFRGIITTNIPIGCGLSSSAALEILIGSIFGRITDKVISPLENALIGRQTENTYFGKPCGLMDQTACAYRGIVHIDFKDPDAPLVNKLFTSFRDHGYQLLVVATGGDHRSLTDEYASIFTEMRTVANYFNKDVGRGLSCQDIFDNMTALRKKAGDRGVLRMLHFIKENERVAKMVKALDEENIQRYLRLVRESGESSRNLLQNCSPAGAIKDQAIPLALTLSDHFLAGDGASRVHGGGFEGTIQSYVPINRVENYCKFMSSYFGEDNVFPIKIRPEGSMTPEL